MSEVQEQRKSGRPENSEEIFKPKKMGPAGTKELVQSSDFYSNRT